VHYKIKEKSTRTYGLDLADLFAGLVEILADLVELELHLLPRLIEDDDLVDKLDGLEATVLRAVDELRVAALLPTEDIDVQHLGRWDQK